MKFSFISLNLTFRVKINTIVFCKGIDFIDYTAIFGIMLKTHKLLGHVQNYYILHKDEHPSPFKVFPSSHRSVMIIPSPQRSLHLPVVGSRIYPGTLPQVLHVLL